MKKEDENCPCLCHGLQNITFLYQSSTCCLCRFPFWEWAKWDPDVILVGEPYKEYK